MSAVNQLRPRRPERRARTRLAYRVWRAFLWGIGLASVGLGLGGAFVSNDDVPAGPAITLVPFGLVFLAWAAMPLAARRRPAKVTLQRVHARDAVVIPSSRARWGVMAFGIGCFAAAALGVAVFADQFDGDPAWNRAVGATIAGFFAVLTGIALTAAGKPPFVAVASDGILLGAGPASAFVPWETIELIGVHREPPPAYHGVRPPEEEWPSYLGIWVSDLDAVELPRWLRVLLALRRSSWRPHLRAAIDGLAASPEQLEDLVRRLRSSPAERERLGTASGRAELAHTLRPRVRS